MNVLSISTFPSESVLHALIISAPPQAYSSKQYGLLLSWISRTWKHKFALIIYYYLLRLCCGHGHKSHLPKYSQAEWYLSVPYRLYIRNNTNNYHSKWTIFVSMICICEYKALERFLKFDQQKTKRNELKFINYLPPCFHSQPSLSGLKNVCIKSLPSSCGILNGSVRIDSNNDTNSSRGKSPPLLIPRFIDMNCSTLGLSLTDGLCNDVFSIIIAKLST